MNPITSRNKKQPAGPPGLRRELAQVVFNGLLELQPRTQVEQQLRALTNDPAELASALRRYDAAIGTVAKGVQ